jgi:hypothetical protein
MVVRRRPSYKVRSSFDHTSVTPRQWGYLAGLIDADGSIIFSPAPRRTGYTIAIYAFNTSIELINWCAATFGGRIENHKVSWMGTKPSYRWCSTRYIDMYYILQNIASMLLVPEKRERALQAFVLIRTELAQEGLLDE